MALKKTPLDHQYLQSYLLKAGVRFDFNIVDTVCQRRLGLKFYLALIAALLLFGLPPGMPGNPVAEIDSAMGDLHHEGISSSMRILLLSLMYLLLFYAFVYLMRYLYFLRLRAKLRSDRAPIVAEAYAVVCLDMNMGFGDYMMSLLSRIMGQGPHGFCRYAVIYKETGTENPRFFLTAAVPARKICFIPDHVGRVFPHRKKNHLYTVDDKSAYQTVSSRIPVGKIFASGASSMSSAAADSASPPDTGSTASQCQAHDARSND